MAQIEPENEPETRTELEIGDGLSYRLENGQIGVFSGERKATRSDVPPRYDLRPDHSLYGRRVLKIVLSGMPNTELDDNGDFVFLDNDGNPRSR